MVDGDFSFLPESVEESILYYYCHISVEILDDPTPKNFIEIFVCQENVGIQTTFQPNQI